MATTENQSNDYDAIYEKYNALMHKLGLKYSGYDEYLAEDATQHAFMHLYIKMTEGEEIINIETYLHTLVKNYIINMLVKLGRELPTLEYEEKIITETHLELSAEESFMEIIEDVHNKQFAELMLEEIEKKNHIWYTIIVEVCCKNRSQVEVAEELGLNETAIYATMRRIRKWCNKHRVDFEIMLEEQEREVLKNTSLVTKNKYW